MVPPYPQLGPHRCWPAAQQGQIAVGRCRGHELHQVARFECPKGSDEITTERVQVEGPEAFEALPIKTGEGTASRIGPRISNQTLREPSEAVKIIQVAPR